MGRHEFKMGGREFKPGPAIRVGVPIRTRTPAARFRRPTGWRRAGKLRSKALGDQAKSVDFLAENRRNRPWMHAQGRMRPLAC
ncbi:hypothetical protein [Mesorhizobium sp. LjNodule214]|uniref:hypothetical protein n=1 Tax=Mesorhizobium sp. LjNodule214 TaxID=3342252 RepID=UPI003ECEF5D3